MGSDDAARAAVPRCAPSFAWIGGVITALAAAWWIAEALAAGDGPFVPFNTHKIIALAIALFCPSARLGSLLIALALIQPFVQTATWDDDVRGRLPETEPFQTLIIGCTALLFLGVRRRHAAHVAELAHTHADRIWLERVSRLGLAVCARLEAPLRAMRDGIAAIRAGHPDAAPLTARMARAYARLDELTEKLALFRRIAPGVVVDATPGGIARLQDEVRASRPSLAAPRRPRSAPRRLPRAPTEETRRAALTLGAMAALGGGLTVAMMASKGLPSTPGVLVCGAGASALVLALGVRLLPRLVYRVLFVAIALAALAGILLHNECLADRGYIDAFPGIKLVLFALAFVAPAGWFGMTIVAVATVSPLAVTYLWWTAEQRDHIPILEPWLTVCIGVVALGVLLAHRRHLGRVHELARARAARDGISQLARLLLAIRDRANSPLQTLRLASDLVRAEHGAAPDDVDAAIEDIRRLVQALPEIEEGDHLDPAELSLAQLESLTSQVNRFTGQPVA